MDIRSIDFDKPNALGISTADLRELGMDPQRLADLRDDLAKISDLSPAVTEISQEPVVRVKSLGEEILTISTLEFAIK